MTTKTPPFEGHPKWTTARFWSFIRSALRQAWNKWPPKYEVLNEAKIKYRGKERNRKWSYRCAACKKTFPGKEVQVDHIIPCGQLKDFNDLPQFVSRMFVGKEHLQVLCKKCHRNKEHDSW